MPSCIATVSASIARYAAHMADGRHPLPGMGSGGMALQDRGGADRPCSAGVPVAIVAGAPDRPLSAWENGANGTIFRAYTAKRRAKNLARGQARREGTHQD
jgi:glutamate 5-kinase